MALKIGITERGDAGIDLSWYKKLNNGTYSGAVLITKKITYDFTNKVIGLHKSGFPIIVHCTCTGWGGSVVEPNAPIVIKQISALQKLISMGFPKENCVLRIDPIIPTGGGLYAVNSVLSIAENQLGLDNLRIRISILDEYKHVKERIKNAGYQPFYPGNNFYASEKELQKTAELLNSWSIPFEACAEPKLAALVPKLVQCGCVSENDLKFMGIDIPDNMLINMQKRNGCMCLSCKTELLSNKCQCPNGCLYCYWK